MQEMAQNEMVEGIDFDEKLEFVFCE